MPEYIGDVSVDGPADVRQLSQLQITKVAVGPMDNNAYLLRCLATGEELLVDAANEANRLIELIDRDRLARVVTTHRHGDHWQALQAVIRATGARLVAHPDDAAGLPLPVDEPVRDGGEVRVGEVPLRVLHLVGHTPGSIALYHEPDGGHLFTGDSLFPGGPGRTTSPRDFTSLMDDLEAKVFGPLADSTWVYPGHGRDTTLGAERPHLAEWRSRGW
jgi:glyoxylase-like metal-dependent hydrolase (beta-lactamase superfamily II)